MSRSPEDMAGAFQKFQDASYNQAQRTLAPQQEAQQAKFAQQMVNKGLDPGSKAYNLAQAQMQRGMNDQNNAAAFGAQQVGMQAQNQAFGQGFQNRSLAQANDQFGRSLNEQGRQFDTGMGEQGRQFDVGMSQRESEFGRNFGLQDRQFGMQQEQMDFNNMLGMGDFGMRLADFSNRNTMQDYNMMEGMLSHAPGGQFNPIDTNAAYSNSMQGANNANNMASSNYGALMGAVGNVAGAAMMPSALEFKILEGKTTQSKRNKIAAKILTMPIYDWDYKPQYREVGDVRRTGVLANDFNRHMIGDEDVQTIDVQRYTAALHVTVQEIFGEVRRLEQLLWHVAEAQGIPMSPVAYKGKKFGEVSDMADKIDLKPENWTPIGED